MNSVRDKQTAILVFGMHRSGTSATTRVLNLLGAELSEQVIEPQFDNPKGFWESAEAVDVHDRLLSGLSRNWSDVRSLPAGWLELPVSRAALVEIVSLIERNFSGKPLWVVKDPRMCLLAPLWLEALEVIGIEAKALFVVRNPWEVAESLRVRNHLGHGHASMMWMQHLLEPEKATRSISRFMVTFDQVLHDWRSTMARVATGLQIAWPNSPENVGAEVDAFLDKGERHHSGGEATLDSIASPLPNVVGDAYKECLAIAEAGSDWDGLRLFADEFASAGSVRVADLWKAALDDVAEYSNQLQQRLHELGLQLQNCERKSDDFEGLLGGAYRSVEELGSESVDAEQAEPPFYAEYYQAKYPDVVGVGYDAHEHFELHGKAEGRVGAPPLAKQTARVAKSMRAIAELLAESGHQLPSIARRIDEAAREDDGKFAVMRARIEALTQEIDSCALQREDLGRQVKEYENALRVAEDRLHDLERAVERQEIEQKVTYRALQDAEARLAASEMTVQATMGQLDESNERFRASEMTVQATMTQLDESNERLRVSAAKQQEQLNSLRFLGHRVVAVIRGRLFRK